jgi:hypothetical protein
MRIIVRALRPRGEGTVLDPFMLYGSTIATVKAANLRLFCSAAGATLAT